MFRVPVFAAFCLAAVPALAQTQATPAQSAPAGPPPAAMAAVQQAGMVFGQCVQSGVPGVPATMTPEAGAASVVNACATQRQALVRAAEALIAALPEAQRSMAQDHLRTQLGGIETQIADGIRQMRAAPAPATAPAPAQ